MKLQFSILAMLMAVTACKPSDPQVAECQEIIKANLRAPSTVKFQRPKIYGTDPKDIYVEFDAQNGFGAMLRSVGICTYRGADLALAEIEIDGKPLSELNLIMAQIKIRSKQIGRVSYTQ